ncbi:MAG: tRNA (adenosine(37)-N6)-threonylcarbamoyltransferase complex dimerization subunit type 1 TsaB [Pseudomonadota bacterium]|nr:tRNA (adenosine(37)-N6)-threonylcarbamoyltransferase complex dimerization subunit type 1 TsaB [Pseudomonadota bacterium]
MRLLAFDTSTEHLSVAVQHGARRWQHQGPGGAQASAALIPAVQALLAQAGLALGEVQAIVFGRGPGSFTGLRTACAVAQGLAWGAGLPVLPVDTLQAVAQAARASHAPQAERLHVLALLDARMNEIYSAPWVWQHGQWQALAAPRVGPAGALAVPQAVPQPDPQPDMAAGAAPAPWLLAGNVFDLPALALPPALAACPRVPALPSASALLDLAPALWAAGAAVPPEQALPLYIRDKVAQTTAERLAQGGVR